MATVRAAVPTARPRMNLQTTSTAMFGANAAPPAPTEKATAATTMRLRLPSLSERSPGLPAPTVTKKIELATKPLRKGVSPSSSLMNKIAPEITPVS